ncbi:MAG: hypothetical protein FWG26_03255 [Betaproteobacteria bacterium]|nr:hypothetical protein [Betaproteobacteria bacterium]
MKPIIKVPLIAAAVLFLPFGAQAAGLGEFTVRSMLGEPLNAEIQLNATQQELQSLTARVAPAEAFSQGGIPYASFVPNVRVTVENRGDRSVLRLSSDVPVNEAIASLVIQLNWDDGRLARTYNFLLEPRDLVIRQPAPVEPTVAAPPTPPPPMVESPPPPLPEIQVAQASDPVPAAELDLGDEPTFVYSGPEPEPEPIQFVQEPAPVAAMQQERPPVEPERDVPPQMPYTAPTPAYFPEADGGDHTVKYGETLGAIASRRMPADVTLDQMMMALYRANQTAFIDSNINRLRTGVILKMPSADEVRSTSAADARREVRVQARDFNAWRAQVASEAVRRPASSTEEDAGMSRGIDAVPPVAEQDRDKVVIASQESSGQGGDAARIQELETDLAAAENAQREASERVRELEAIKSLEDQRTKLQEQIASAPSEQPVTETPPAPVVEETPPTAEASASSEPAAAESESTQDAAIKVENDFQSQDQEDDPLIAKLKELIADPAVVGVVALVALLLFGFLAFRSWQRKRSDIGLDTLSQDATSMFPGEATSIFGDNGGQSVDTTASSVIHTDFSQTGLSIDTNEGVDPVAEADVYMAYGRDSQAEEILNDALKSDPKRGAIYVKLLEIYAQRQDLTQFEATASELFSRTEGQGRDWEKAVQMGRRLDPSNPLYSGKPSRQGGGELSKLPGLEPTLEEPSSLDMGAPTTGSGMALSGLDFGTSPTTDESSAANAGQLKETAVMQGQMDDALSTRAATSTIPSAQAKPKRSGSAQTAAAGPATEVDFQFEPAETTPKAAGSIDFDLGKSQAVSEAGKQPISVTVSRQPAAGVASRQPTGVSSKKAGSRPAAPKTAGDLAGPFDFDLPAQGQGASGDMSGTVVLPSARGGNERGDDVTLDLEKTSFDPDALDFDLNLDLKQDAATGSFSPKAGDSRSPASNGLTDAVDAGEIDTKLELALAYGDMGDTEGALELLKEVVAQGNAAQKAEAKALIAKLG